MSSVYDLSIAERLCQETGLFGSWYAVSVLPYMCRDHRGVLEACFRRIVGTHQRTTEGEFGGMPVLETAVRARSSGPIQFFRTTDSTTGQVVRPIGNVSGLAFTGVVSNY